MGSNKAVHSFYFNKLWARGQDLSNALCPPLVISHLVVFVDALYDSLSGLPFGIVFENFHNPIGEGHIVSLKIVGVHWSFGVFNDLLNFRWDGSWGSVQLISDFVKSYLRIGPVGLDYFVEQL